MAKVSLNQALENVEMAYAEVVDIGNDMLSDLFEPINRIFSDLDGNIQDLTTDQIRDYILRLQLRAYEISETKDKSAMKAAIAEAIREEAFAANFNAADGTAAVKNNIALIESSKEVVVEALYEMVANLLKTKLDQLHRMVDALKSILVSRMQEAKLTMGAME